MPNVHFRIGSLFKTNILNKIDKEWNGFGDKGKRKTYQWTISCEKEGINKVWLHGQWPKKIWG